MADVLIIEDSSLVIQMLTMVCDDAGHRSRSCEQFSEVESALHDGRPDIVITDLNLPDVNDEDVVSRLRAVEDLHEVPIVIISGRPRQELESIAERMGAQAALSKDDGMPVISSKLPPLIDELLGSDSESS